MDSIEDEDESDELDAPSDGNDLFKRQSLVNGLPAPIGPTVGPLLTTVGNTVAGLPLVGGVVSTAGATVAGLPVVGPVVKGKL